MNPYKEQIKDWQHKFRMEQAKNKELRARYEKLYSENVSLKAALKLFEEV